MKTKTKQLFILLLFLIASSGVKAQDEFDFTLAEAQEYALSNSYVIRNSKLDVDAAKKKVWETIAMGLPQVSGTSNYTKNIDAAKSPMPVAIIPKDFWFPLGIPEDTPLDGTFPISFAQKFNADYGFKIDQLIFDGSYIVGVNSAKIYLQMAAETKEKTEIEIKQAVAQSYFLVLAAEENLKVMKENLKNSEKLESDTKALYENGFTEEQDVDQMRLLVQKSENEILKAEREIRVSRMVLKYTMGIDVEERIVLTQPLTEFLNPLLDGEENLGGFDYSSHIDYRMLDTQRQLSMKELRLAQAAYLPRLTAFYNWSKMSFGDNANLYKSSVPWYKSSMFGFNLSIPIFTSGQQMAKVQQARFSYQQSENEQALAEQTLKKDYLSAVADIESAIDQYHNDIENKKLAKKIYDKTTIKYNNGISSSVELSQIETQYIQSQGAWVASVIQLLNSKITLEKAIGKL
ncbi:TolC family protein [uncultured Sunxiuqinia sp.]|uniref:TolC family protein n=1 Tax=uncultured Sunxiuqinia sp. TaxID=1573825 RepID=UPI002AA73A76|nr:TolC family protein [uncultured Sunxiuqinia sp.]